ncbi:50S ribosomal protein L10 [Candidatus Woesearchaeota archaeon]|nr:50S ribosomal protein L10 [Candidatus Woesearchaeota archaeon]
MYKPKVAKKKLATVQQILTLAKTHPIVGIINVQNIPAPQLQRMRLQLRDNVTILMAKKSLTYLALDSLEHEKKGVSGLKAKLSGMPALVFTAQNPFRLASVLRKSRSSAPAKAGQAAPKDIWVPAGQTQFTPGPIISELASVGIKTGVEGGKLAIKQDVLVVKEGEKINQKLAGVLMKLGIQPIEIGLDMLAIYEAGVIYGKDVLDVPETKHIDDLKRAAAEAESLAIHIAYPTRDNIKKLLAKAHISAKGLAISKQLISDALLQKLVTDAEREALAIRKLIQK